MAESKHIPTMPQTSESGHIPTMPQAGASEHIPTMPQASVSEHIPTMPQAGAGEHIPTVPQAGAGAHVPTTPQMSVDADGHISTMPQAAGTQQNSGNGRLIYTKLRFQDDRGQEFIVDGSAPVSTDTGEAQIYRCKKADGTGDYVAKILMTLRPDSAPKKLKTRKRVIDFLDRYSLKPESHILPLIGHGVFHVNNQDYFADIYPYCEGGDLGSRVGEFSLRQLTQDVIPALNEALHLFHQERLVHRDLKPDNLYYYDGRMVIGDFGITCELNTDDYAVDTEKIGTLGYFAPELMSEAAIAASDYYAMGQTIWTLYHGEMMYRETIRSHGGFFSQEARNTVSDLMRKNELPGLDEIDRKDEFFEVLIRGLLQYDPNTRFGYREVNQWLKGDKSLYLRVKTLRADEIFERTIEVNGKYCIDNAQVAAQLGVAWEQSIALVYNATLFQRYQYTLCRDKDAEVIDEICNQARNGADNHPEDARVYLDMGLCTIILYLSQYKLLCWRGLRFEKPVDISDELKRVHQAGGDKSDLYVFITSGVAREWLQGMGVRDEQVLNELDRLAELASSTDMGVETAYHWMSYMLMEDRKKASYKDCFDVNDIADMLLDSPAALYDVVNGYCCVEDPQLLGFLCALGYDEAVSSFLTDDEIDYKRHYEMLFDFFENNVKNEETLVKVYRAYSEFGPMAYLVWWKQHLEEYKFCGTHCKTIEQNAMAVQINAGANLAAQRAELSKLEQLYSDFKQYFRFDFLVGMSGIRKIVGKDYIYSGKLSCMLAYHFLSQDAPLGYKYALKL